MTRAELLMRIGLCLLLAASVAAVEAVPEPWSEDLEAALTDKAHAGKPLVLLFTSPGCEWCERMLHESSETPAVKQALAGVEAVVVHAEQHPELVARLGIDGFPTTALVNRSHQLVRVVAGYVPARDFATMLRVLVLHGDERGDGRLIAPTEDLGALARGEDGPAKLAALLGRGDPEQRHLVRELLGGMPDARPALWKALDDDSLAVRVDGAAALAQQLGEDGGYDPFAPGAERAAAAKAWREHVEAGAHP